LASTRRYEMRCVNRPTTFWLRLRGPATKEPIRAGSGGHKGRIPGNGDPGADRGQARGVAAGLERGVRPGPRIPLGARLELVARSGARAALGGRGSLGRGVARRFRRLLGDLPDASPRDRQWAGARPQAIRRAELSRLASGSTLRQEWHFSAAD